MRWMLGAAAAAVMALAAGPGQARGVIATSGGGFDGLFFPGLCAVAERCQALGFLEPMLGPIDGDGVIDYFQRGWAVHFSDSGLRSGGPATGRTGFLQYDDRQDALGSDNPLFDAVWTRRGNDWHGDLTLQQDLASPFLLRLSAVDRGAGPMPALQWQVFFLMLDTPRSAGQTLSFDLTLPTLQASDLEPGVCAVSPNSDPVCPQLGALDTVTLALDPAQVRAAVPEPGTLWSALAALVAAGLAGARRRAGRSA